MKTFPIHDKSGALVAFEISNSYFLSSGQVARYLAKSSQITISKTRRLFDFGNEIHVEFSFQDDDYHVWEPYGDNSRYWVGPSDNAVPKLSSVDDLRQLVENSWPGPISRTFYKLKSYMPGRNSA